MRYQAGVHKKGDFSVVDLIKNTTMSDNYSKAGAIAQFIGIVRGETIQGENVQKLKLEAYEEKANEVLLKCRIIPSKCQFNPKMTF